MIFLNNHASLEKFSELVTEFRSMYEVGFPDANERESFELILERVREETESDQPHTVIILSLKGRSTVRGGIIADWYAGSGALHLTYLIVDPLHRKQGTATELINKGIPTIIKWIDKARGVKIKNVFFESNNPFKTITDNFNPTDRLNIFARMGAKYINIPYVQPALEKGKESVDSLLLLSFTQFNETGDRIPARDILAFLTEFYKGLGINAENLVYAKMDYSLSITQDKDGFVQLESLMEEARYSFDKVSVTWHYMEMKDKNVYKPVCPKCDHFFSFETDLLNYQNQKNPPFATCFDQYFDNIELIFPASYLYTSEGASHVKLAVKRNLKISVSVSYTTIHKTGERMFHVTFSPSKDETFSELDIIKLSEPFGSKQEGCLFDDKIKLRVVGKETTVDGFLRSLKSCDPNARYVNQQAGIVQMDIENSLKNLDDSDSFFDTFKAPDEKAISGKMVGFSNALCGIILGIYDFDRMGEEEILDTIRPILVCRDSFSVVYRGLLLRICRKDDIMKKLSGTVIVLPYLLIPNMVLTYNEYVLSKAMGILESLDSLKGNSITDIENKHIQINDILGYKYLQNVFQYPSEKKIIKDGNIQHGIDDIYSTIQKRSNLLKETITKKRKNRTNRTGAILNALLVCIPMVQLTGLLPRSIIESWWVLLFIGASIGMALYVYRLTRRVRPNDQNV